MAGTFDDGTLFGTPVMDVPEDMAPVIDKLLAGGDWQTAMAEAEAVVCKRNAHVPEKPERKTPVLRIVK